MRKVEMAAIRGLLCPVLLFCLCLKWIVNKTEKIAGMGGGLFLWFLLGCIIFCLYHHSVGNFLILAGLVALTVGMLFLLVWCEVFLEILINDIQRLVRGRK